MLFFLYWAVIEKYNRQSLNCRLFIINSNVFAFKLQYKGIIAINKTRQGYVLLNILKLVGSFVLGLNNLKHILCIKYVLPVYKN